MKVTDNADKNECNLNVCKCIGIKPIDQNIAILTCFSARKICIPIAFDLSTWGHNKTCFCGF